MPFRKPIPMVTESRDEPGSGGMAEHRHCFSILFSVEAAALPRDRLSSDSAQAPHAGNPTYPGTALQIC